jgi:hypothetical protein
MLDQIISLLTPQIVVTLLAAIAAFATTHRADARALP